MYSPSIYPPLGTVLRVPFNGYWHYGIWAGAGSVIHNSKQRGKVVKESLEAFANGQTLEVHNKISSVDPLAAHARAHQYLGMAYRLFSQNCEHFVRLAHGLRPESPQIQKAILASGFAAASVMLARHGNTAGALLALGFGGLTLCANAF